MYICINPPLVNDWVHSMLRRWTTYMTQYIGFWKNTLHWKRRWKERHTSLCAPRHLLPKNPPLPHLSTIECTPRGEGCVLLVFVLLANLLVWPNTCNIFLCLFRCRHTFFWLIFRDYVFSAWRWLSAISVCTAWQPAHVTECVYGILVCLFAFF